MADVWWLVSLRCCCRPWVQSPFLAERKMRSEGQLFNFSSLAFTFDSVGDLETRDNHSQDTWHILSHWGDDSDLLLMSSYVSLCVRLSKNLERCHALVNLVVCLRAGLCVCLCMFLRPSLYSVGYTFIFCLLFVACLYACQFISIRLSACSSVWRYVRLIPLVFACLSIYVCLLACPFICPSVCEFACVPGCVS